MSIIASLAGSFGFKTTFSVSLSSIVSLPAGSEKTVPLPMLVPIDRRFFEIDATIRMSSQMTADAFDLTIVGLSRQIYDQLQVGKTVVTINLGYSDGGTADVMSGILLERNLAVGDGFYEAHLKGIDYVFSRLQNPQKHVTRDFTKQTLKQIATAICGDLGFAVNGADGPTLDAHAITNETPLQALMELARIGGFCLQAKDGAVYLGLPDAIGKTDFVPIDDDASGQDGAARGAGAKGAALQIVDFTVAGRPKLRPADTVTIGTDSYVIESVSHVFKRIGSYECVGRALPSSATMKDTAAAAKPTAASTANRLRDVMDDRNKKRPAVTAGEIGAYNDGHTADVKSGVVPQPTMVTPTTQAPLADAPAVLAGKPIASPFAFDKCGLITPVYPGMRALMVHGWQQPNDAVVDGFLWADGMAIPANNPGDWWLHLPTQIGGDNRPTGNGVDDLIDKDGNRVIAVNGLKISVGQTNLNPVGTRPNAATASQISIETDSGGSKIVMTNDDITLTVGGLSVKITSSKVTIG